mgnify:CR=1 FL=1
MKKILLISILFISVSCSSVKFVGSPISSNDYDLKNKRSLNEEVKEKWSLLDINSDMIPGMSVLKANQELIKNKKGENVIVAIIDSGVEIDHPYLSPYIWINTDEIPNNKIDDDNNGYIDDINGWNFLGESNQENLEYVRLFKKTSLDDPLRQVYKNEIDKARSKNNETINRVGNLSRMLYQSDSLIASITGNKFYSLEEAKQISTKTFKLDEAIRFLEVAKSNNWSQKSFLEAKDYYQSSNDFHNNIDFNGKALTNAVFKGLTLRNCKFGTSNINGANFDGCHMNGTSNAVGSTNDLSSCVDFG